MSSIAITSSPIPTSRTINWGRAACSGLITVAASVAANVLVYYVGRAFVSYDPQFLPLANVSGAIAFTLPAAVVAVLLYALLLRFARCPARTFTVIAAVVFVITLIPDLTYIPTVPGDTVAQTAILILMHIVAAAVIVRMLTTLVRPQSR